MLEHVLQFLSLFYNYIQVNYCDVLLNHTEDSCDIPTNVSVPH